MAQDDEPPLADAAGWEVAGGDRGIDGLAVYAEEGGGGGDVEHGGEGVGFAPQRRSGWTIEKLMKAALAGNPELVHKYDHEVIATSLEVYAESFDAA